MSRETEYPAIGIAAYGQESPCDEHRVEELRVARAPHDNVTRMAGQALYQAVEDCSSVSHTALLWDYTEHHNLDPALDGVGRKFPENRVTNCDLMGRKNEKRSFLLSGISR